MASTPEPGGPGPGLAVGRPPSPLVELADPELDARGVRLLAKRDDLLGWGALAGNKWRKLRLNLADARDRGAGTLLTFGGAYSNHLRAVAEAGRRFGFATVGVVRGDEARELNWSLRMAAEAGMRLVPVDRATYRRRADPDYPRTLRDRFGDFYLVPEGGSNALGVRGCAEIVREIVEAEAAEFDLVCCACGTGGTLAGLSHPLAPHQRALGFSALPNADLLVPAVGELQTVAFGGVTDNWTIRPTRRLGRFARMSPELRVFSAEFAERHGFALESTYVARMMHELYAGVRDGGIPGDRTIVAVITGPADPRDTGR